jgi:hypothetical protein
MLTCSDMSCWIMATSTDPRPVLFSTGQIVATPGALRLLEQQGIVPMLLVARHVRGDWGCIETDDATANVEAVRLDNRILSSYPFENGNRVWVITEWNRSVTTLLLPEEY